MKDSKHTILYVDDEPANLRSFKSAFRRLYKVHTAEHPIKGIEIVKENDIDIVVSDHRMPELIGTDFLKEVFEYDSKIRRIILSGFVKKEELQQANKEFGLHGYISKPWDFEDVQAVFQKLLSEEDPPLIAY